MAAPFLATLLVHASTELAPTSRIVGGSEVPEYRYPFLVSLRSFSSHICGGSLIEPSWVLTAAHCINPDRPATSYSVMLHAHDKSSPSSTWHRCTQVISVARTVCHPSYNSRTMLADICLLQLQGTPYRSAQRQDVGSEQVLGWTSLRIRAWTR